jgi:hypothetical protein
VPEGRDPPGIAAVADQVFSRMFEKAVDCRQVDLV